MLPVLAFPKDEQWQADLVEGDATSETMEWRPSIPLDSPLTRSLKENPKLTMKDVDSFVKVNKAPHSGIVKGYKFFCEGFIEDYEGKLRLKCKA